MTHNHDGSGVSRSDGASYERHDGRKPAETERDSPGRVVELYVAPEASDRMRRQHSVELVADGTVGDRYCEGRGHFAVDGCAVTLIAAEAIEHVSEEFGIELTNGQHRRNIVTEGVDLRGLLEAQVQLGTAHIRGTRPRPPCAHLEETADKDGVASALDGRAGICAEVVNPGVVEIGDETTVVSPDPATAGELIADRLREEASETGEASHRSQTDFTE